MTKPETAEKSLDTPTENSTKFRPLRTWVPLLVLVVGIVTSVLPLVVQEPSEAVGMTAVLGPFFAAVLLLLWWVLASRARWTERLVGVVGIFAIYLLAVFISDPSMASPPPMLKLTIPLGFALFALGAIACSHWLSMKRTIGALVMMAVGVGFSALLRCEGMSSDAEIAFDWRWVPTAEQQLVDAKQSESKTSMAEVDSNVDAALAAPEWPEFRGTNRDGRYLGPAIETNWPKQPELLWKLAVGPGWSSFTVAGDLIFTQEQRGDVEAVVCYDAKTGKEIWAYEVEARFEESIGGPGPRATPTIADGMLFAHGAMGDLVRLDPKTGSEIWRQNIGTLADREPPTWGFSSSPLVTDGLVAVHAGGENDKGTFAFDAKSGELKWTAPAGDHSYSSPQLATVAGQKGVLMLTNTGMNFLNFDDGKDMLNYEWVSSGYRTLQPLVLNGDSILVASGAGTGTRRIDVSSSDGKLEAREAWTNKRFAPDFNDMVLLEGHAYGFAGSIFACFDLETGKRKWKGGRYGKGQVLLAEKSRALIVLSERGKVVLLNATPSGHEELASFQAIEGKTWAHPVLVGDRLFVRNAKEAACYRLPLAKAESVTTEP